MDTPPALGMTKIIGDPPADRKRRVYVVLVFLPLLLVTLIFFLRATSFPLLARFARQIDFVGLDAWLSGVMLTLLFVSISSGVVSYLQTGVLPLPAKLRRILTPPPTKVGIHPPTKDEFAVVAKPPHPEEDRFRYITAHAEELVGRLSTAIEQQRQRNNINVGFGFFITLVGITVLVYFVPSSQDAIKPDRPWSVLTFLPRLSLVVLIELFAYFFLNLYRDGLAEMKYLQNELTTIRMRTLGLRAAIVEGHETSAAEIAQSFATTDRNGAGVKTKATAENATELLKTAQEAIKVVAKLSGAKASKD